ncbi:ABC transporter ATP-binding protein [Paenibacillus mesophilus]|uniref:ABC transporter ATP-binding protein n=1 Tax=Paenibacillus mesophilus TaxID=2582849 RepID=UPI00110DB37E|nr:ABC transporter ATP-binding protein [Paenibacillus mesophilus]TMV47826.1 ABC transporter ATP-binding protein [Paenibacillus mesophilus]
MRMNERETILQVDNLRVAYRQNRQFTSILSSLSLDVKKGDIVALIGESGSGKSTIAKAITGLLPPSAHVGGGTLRIGSDVVAELAGKSTDWESIRGRRLAMLFQDARLALNPVLTIKAHFQECLLYHRMATREQVVPIAAQLLNKLGFANGIGILDRYPFELSGGMCQRVCLALALCLKPAVLIADEPTSALDTVSQKEVLDLLQKLQTEFGLTVLLITHDIAVANAISNRVIVLNQGAIEEEGDTRIVFSKPRTAYTRQLLASRSIMAGSSGMRAGEQTGEPILEIIQLEKSYGPKKGVLDNINLKVNKGDIIGILGQSGCGKSTLARCLTGLETPSRGRILYRGTDIGRLNGKYRRELSKHIQMVFQDARASLHPGRTALQLVQEPLQYLNVKEKKMRETLAGFYLEEVGIMGDAQMRRPPQLSTGQCQRIAIARALVLGPDILICDEAVSALDMNVQAQILSLLQQLHKQYHFSILMISHDIRVLQSFCHQIAVMEGGSICEVSRGAQIHESEQPYTQMLLKCAGDLEEGLA